MYQLVLIYSDGSTLSHKAVNAGIALAAALDAQALAYSVVPKYPHWNAETGMAMTLSETANFENERAMEAQAIVDAVQKEAHTHYVKTIALTGKGAIAENNIRTAKRHHCDLIVMASHGHGVLGRIIMGSVAQRVVAESDIPVLLVQ